MVAILAAQGVAAGDVQVCNTYTELQPSDFLFLIDGSGSMCPYISQLESQLQTFIQQLTVQNVDATYAVAAFGGTPDLLQPFSKNGTLTQATLASIGCSRSGWEAGLEAIRMGLNTNNGSDFNKRCGNTVNSTSQCVLQWRPNAKRQIIIATDEDSDIPTLSRYRMLNQLQSNTLCPTRYTDILGTVCPQPIFEPPFQPRTYWPSGYQYFRNSSTPMTMDATFVNEITATADLLIQNAAMISLLIKSDFNANRNGPISNYDSTSSYFNSFAPNKSDINSVHTSIYQYGDPAAAVQDAGTFSNFNPSATLANLGKEGISNSLQAQVLSRGGLARIFRIQDIINPVSGKFVIQNIYTEIAVQIKNCSYVYQPDSTTTAGAVATLATTLAPASSSIQQTIPNTTTTAQQETMPPDEIQYSTSGTVTSPRLTSSSTPATQLLIIIPKLSTTSSSTVYAPPILPTLASTLAQSLGLPSSLSLSLGSGITTGLMAAITATLSYNGPTLTTYSQLASTSLSTITQTTQSPTQAFYIITNASMRFSTMTPASPTVAGSGVVTSASPSITGTVSSNGVISTTYAPVAAASSTPMLTVITTVQQTTSIAPTTLSSQTLSISNTSSVQSVTTSSSAIGTSSFISGAEGSLSQTTISQSESTNTAASETMSSSRETSSPSGGTSAITGNVNIATSTVSNYVIASTTSAVVSPIVIATIILSLISALSSSEVVDTATATAASTFGSLSTAATSTHDVTLGISASSTVFPSTGDFISTSTIPPPPSLAFTTSKQTPTFTPTFGTISTSGGGDGLIHFAGTDMSTSGTSHSLLPYATPSTSEAATFVSTSSPSTVATRFGSSSTDSQAKTTITPPPELQASSAWQGSTSAGTSSTIAADSGSGLSSFRAIASVLSSTVISSTTMATISISSDLGANWSVTIADGTSESTMIGSSAPPTEISSSASAPASTSSGQGQDSHGITASLIAPTATTEMNPLIIISVYPGAITSIPELTTEAPPQQTSSPASIVSEVSEGSSSVQNSYPTYVTTGTSVISTQGLSGLSTQTGTLSSSFNQLSEPTTGLFMTAGSSSREALSLMTTVTVTRPNPPISNSSTITATPSTLPYVLFQWPAVRTTASAKIVFIPQSTVKTVPTSVARTTESLKIVTTLTSSEPDVIEIVSITTNSDASTTMDATLTTSTSSPPEPVEAPPAGLPKLSPPATIGLSVAGGVIAVGAAGALAFMYKSGAIGTNLVTTNTMSDPMLQMAKGNPLYEGPGGVHENPLYQPDGGEGGGSGGEWWKEV